MRARTLGVFVLGFAAGVASLTAVLWTTGSLQLSTVHAGNPAVRISTPILPPSQPASAPPANAETSAPAAPTAAPGQPQAPPHLAMPIAGIDPATLTDTFNEMHAGKKHEALDIPAPRNTPVHAVAEGNVVKLFESKEGGHTVYQFDDSQTYCYYYAHLDHYATGLKEGTLLRKGDVLGYVGSTGNASEEAPHLHFAVNILGPDKHWWQGTPIDPLPLLR